MGVTVMTSSTERFSNRVASYVAVRPCYPVAVIDFLAARCDLMPQTAEGATWAGGLDPDRRCRNPARR
jgi:hypothetical protein